MRRIKILLALGFFSCYGLFAQGRIPVTETTLPLAFDQTAEVYYSFAAGDEIVFNMEMVQGKHVRTVEIIELPNNLVFSAFKADVIGEKRIRVRKKGLYLFRFYSSSLTNRVCRYKIDRIPSSPETRNFNTDWKWETIRDTVYTPYQQDSLVGYEIVSLKKREKTLVKMDTIFVEVISKTERVHSQTAIGKSHYSYINVSLPRNEYYPSYENPYRTIETLAWSHWLGVGQESVEAYNETENNLKETLGVLGELTGYGALAQLAISGISIFNSPIGDNVNYRFIGVFNGGQKVFHSGNGTSDARRHVDFTQGDFTIELYNDNIRRGIDVAIKIIVAQLVRVWEDTEYEEEVREPRYVTLNKIRMDIQETQVRVPVEQ